MGRCPFVLAHKPRYRNSCHGAAERDCSAGCTASRCPPDAATITRTAGAGSFPLNRARWLGRHVIDHAVDTLDLIDDAGGGAAEEVHVEGEEVGGHAID